MKIPKMALAAAAFAALSVTTLSTATFASDQSHKNNWRNGAILGGAAALYGLHTHNTTTTLLGAGAAAYSANRYEQDRKNQSARSRYRRSRYHHTYRHYAR